jgi:hypothetical protein
VRKIDTALDLSWLRSELAPHYSSMGRPSIDPELMIRMLVVGYVFAIRSERLICREVQVNLAYRWFCKLGIEDANRPIRCSRLLQQNPPEAVVPGDRLSAQAKHASDDLGASHPWQLRPCDRMPRKIHASAKMGKLAKDEWECAGSNSTPTLATQC